MVLAARELCPARAGLLSACLLPAGCLCAGTGGGTGYGAASAELAKSDRTARLLLRPLRL